jgi:predicted ABC-type ATPase
MAAGKTTWAMRRLPEILTIRDFVNADEIARGLSPFDPESSALAAGRVMDIALIYDNSDDSNTLIAARHLDGPFVIHDQGRWSQVEEAIR